MSGFEEETYSTIFTSLKHPVRRKILRMLSEKPRNFSEILEALGISSSHLTYHLENLGELVSKTENGKYKLSTFGEAAVGTMSKVEGAPKITEPKLLSSLSIRWKPFFVVLMAGLVVLAGVSYTQYQSLGRLSSEYENLTRSYDELCRIYLSTIAPTTISPPISKSQAIHIALEYGRWNETTLKDMVATATLQYMKFEPIREIYEGDITWRLEGGIEFLYCVTEPVSDYSPVHVEMSFGNVTYRYIWAVYVRALSEFVNNMFSIPPSGLYYVDAATGEVIPLLFHSRVW